MTNSVLVFIGGLNFSF